MGSIQVSHVGWRRPGGAELLRDMTFTVGNGERVALVGANGVGKTTFVGAISEIEPLTTEAAMTEASVEVRQVPEKMRPSDVEILISDSSRFRAATGWEPQISLDQMLSDTLEYWRERV